MKKIVITGAPCTGKTEFIQWMCLNYNNVYRMPEVASILKEMGFPFNSFEDRMNFQYKVYNLQRSLEKWTEENCIEDAIVICDRGTLDVFAYCELSKMINIAVQEEYKRYDVVLHFRCATTLDAYEKYRYGNSLRDEDFDRVLELDNKLENLWKCHSVYHEVAWTTDKNEKYKRALEILSLMFRLD